MMFKPALALLLAIAAPSSAFAQTEAKPPSGRITGHVIAMDTRKPIRGAIVRAVSAAGRQMYQKSGADGRYEFKDLAAGRYTLDARAERFLGMYLGGQPYTGLSAVIPRGVTLRDGEQFDKADFTLPRGSAIEGRIVDEFGDPAPGLVLQVSQVVWAGGRRRLMPIGSAANVRASDDRGYFRVHGLAPGTYYLSALSGAFAEQAETGGFAPTYYPGTTDIAAAQPVKLGFGEELNLTFPLTPARMARVAGLVTDPDGKPVPRASLSLSVADTLGVSDFFIARGVTEPDGTFTFRNVPPGKFTLQAYGPPPPGGPGNLGAGSFGWLPLIIDGQDQRDLVVRVAFGPSLRGRVISSATGGAPFNPRDVSVTALPVQFDSAPVGGGPPPFSMQDDGTFEVKNMSGRRIIRVGVRNPAWMVEKITRDGRDITDEPVDFTKGEIGDIEVVLTNRVTSIAGFVTDEKANRVNDYTVVVFAADSGKWTDRSRFIAIGRPAQDGGFTVRGLPPEEYFAIALPYAVGPEWQDPEFLRTLQEAATSLLLAEGEAKTVTLKLAPAR